MGAAETLFYPYELNHFFPWCIRFLDFQGLILYIPNHHNVFPWQLEATSQDPDLDAEYVDEAFSRYQRLMAMQPQGRRR